MKPVAGVERDLRLHNVDGLRAVAIVLILFHHSINNGILTPWLTRHGYFFVNTLLRQAAASGVELFFVISGVVLLRPYLRGARSFCPSQYFKRRVVRIWPTYLVALFVAGLLVAITTEYPTPYTTQNIPNFALGDWLRQVVIIQLGSTRLYNDAWWSLGVEVLFYTCVPMLLSIFRSGGNKVASHAFLGIVAIVVAEVTYGNKQLDQSFVGGFPSIRLFLDYLPCFVAGMILATREIGNGLAFGSIAFALPYAVVSAKLGLNNHTAYAVLYTGIVALSFQGHLKSVLAQYPLVWLGERSYSLFLVHVTVYWITGYALSAVEFERYAYYLVTSRAIGNASALFAAMALFYLVERHFARGLVTAGNFWYRSKRMQSSMTGGA